MAIYYYAYGYASVPVLSIAVAVWLVVCLPCSGLVYLYVRQLAICCCLVCCGAQVCLCIDM